MCNRPAFCGTEKPKRYLAHFALPRQLFIKNGKSEHTSHTVTVIGLYQTFQIIVYRFHLVLEQEYAMVVMECYDD